MSGRDPVPELLRLGCERCGGSFELRALQASVVCPYCAQPQRISTAVRSRLAAYGTAVNEAQSREAEHHLMVDRHGSAYGSGRAMIVLYILMILVVAIGGLVIVLGSGDPGSVMMGGMVAVYGLTFASAVLSVVYILRRRAPHEARGGRFLAVCPSCGAPEELAVGQMHRTCSHCRVDLVPSDAVIEGALGIAEANVRAAALAKLRSERAMFAGIGGNKGVISIVAKVFIVALPVAGTIMLHRQAALGLEPPEAPLAWGGVTLAVIVGLGVQHALRLQRKRSWSELLNAPGAASINDLRGLITWLDTYWTDTYGKGYSPRRVGGHELHATALHVRGFPVLVVVWSPLSRKESFVDILIAGVRQSEGHGHAADGHRRALAALGFANPAKSTAGVQLSAEGEGFKVLAAIPDRRHALQTALTAAVELALLDGFVPVPPA